MKNKIFITIVILFCSVTIIIGQKDTSQFQNQNNKADNHPSITNIENRSSFFFQKKTGVSHSKQPINCKTCHSCEYPTKNDPCLKYCPREGMMTVHHSPDESPEIIIMDEMSTRFGAVVFSHKLHAQMSEMSDGCQGCHHFNTTGPILACKKCHEQTRQREDISKTDLKGAYHRQCMNCHRQWSHTTDCNSCHLPKNDDFKRKISEEVSRISGKNHPPIILPTKLVFETGYSKGPIVTFYHDDHIKLFDLTCNSCHQHDNCIKCHDLNNKLTHNIVESQKIHKVNKSFDDHHKPCVACHKQDHCSDCHSTKELEPWSHEKSTRFALKHYHEKVACNKCHIRKSQFEKLSIECYSCHKDWKLGSFKHSVTGLILDDNHNSIECNECHNNMNFSSKPTCENCHDDKSFPKHLPGKLRKNNIMNNSKSKITKK
ncbi:MAG: cytochrome c family protein [Candidatus Kapabacteria bacterium]|nr:cytochrome c family protein [Candidatus Kapabacteria bacterium]